MFAIYKWLRVTLLTVAAKQKNLNSFCSFFVFETLPLNFSHDFTAQLYQMLAQKIKILKWKVLFDLKYEKIIKIKMLNVKFSQENEVLCGVLNFPVKHFALHDFMCLCFEPFHKLKIHNLPIVLQTIFVFPEC